MSSEAQTIPSSSLGSRKSAGLARGVSLSGNIGSGASGVLSAPVRGSALPLDSQSCLVYSQVMNKLRGMRKVIDECREENVNQPRVCVATMMSQLL